MRTQINTLCNAVRSHSQQYGDVQVIFSKFLVQFKMTATDRLHIFVSPKTQNFNLWRGWCCRSA